MSADRELLELAAKAIGGRYIYEFRSSIWAPHFLRIFQRTPVGAEYGPPTFDGPWTPLSDDGDALRLAVKLHIVPEFHAASETIPARIYANLPKRKRGWADGQPTWVSAEYVPEEMWETGRAEDQRFADWYLQEYPVVVRGIGPATRRAIVLAAAEIGKAMP